LALTMWPGYQLKARSDSVGLPVLLRLSSGDWAAAGLAGRPEVFPPAFPAPLDEFLPELLLPEPLPADPEPLADALPARGLGRADELFLAGRGFFMASWSLAAVRRSPGTDSGMT
jgi:hypothetical protein